MKNFLTICNNFVRIREEFKHFFKLISRAKSWANKANNKEIQKKGGARWRARNVSIYIAVVNPILLSRPDAKKAMICTHAIVAALSGGNMTGNGVIGQLQNRRKQNLFCVKKERSRNQESKKENVYELGLFRKGVKDGRRKKIS